jgi:RNA recognition motif-containing protein
MIAAQGSARGRAWNFAHSQRPMLGRGLPREEDAMNIYVGNIAFALTEADLRAAFEVYGTVDAVRLVTDQASGQPRGFGFVEMAAASEAQAAIAGLHGTEWQGRTLTVNEARPRNEGRPRTGSRPGGGQGGRRF